MVEANAATLVDYDNGQLDVRIEGVDRPPDLFQFALDDMRDLALTYAVAIQEDPLRQCPVDLRKLVQRVLHVGCHLGRHILEPIAGASLRVPSREGCIQRGHERSKVEASFGRVVVRVVATNHGILQGQSNSPGLAADLGGQLDGDLDGRRNGSPSIAQQLGGHHLSHETPLDAGNLLDRVVALLVLVVHYHHGRGEFL